MTRLKCILFKDTNKGSITIETAICVPFFIFLILIMVTYLNFIVIEDQVNESIHEVITDLQVESYVYYQSGLKSSVVDVLSNFEITKDSILTVDSISDLYIYNKLKKKIKSKHYNRKFITVNIDRLDIKWTNQKKHHVMDINYSIKQKLFDLNKIYNEKVTFKVYEGGDNSPEVQLGNNSRNEKIVYETKTGECYHQSDCYHLRKSKIPISLDKAKKTLRPCSHCYK